MAAKRQHPRSAEERESQEKRDRELDAWLDRAIGARRADPKPVLHDL